MGKHCFFRKNQKKSKKIKTFFQKPIAFLKKMWYNNQVARTWPLSQAAKTSPSHGEGMGSIPVGVTKKENIRTCSDVFFLSKPQAWYGITRQRAWNRRRRMASSKMHFLRLDSIRDCVAIPYGSTSRFHTRLRLDFIHAFGVIWMRKENDMGKNLLLEYSEQLACEIAKLCNTCKIDSNTAYQIKKSSSSVFANISEAQYPQSLADMLSKFEIARKECIETESWLKLILSSESIDEVTFKKYRNLCGRIRRMLTSSCITIENKLKQG